MNNNYIETIVYHLIKSDRAVLFFSIEIKFYDCVDGVILPSNRAGTNHFELDRNPIVKFKISS